MVKEIFVDLSLSSTRRCQLGKDFRHSRAPMAELRTTCPTPAAIMFHSSSISCGMGEHTRKTLVTPSSAGGNVSFFEKSARTVGVPVGALAASVAERNMARCSAPLLATSLNTAFPVVPLAPVTKYMILPPEECTLVQAGWAKDGVARAPQSYTSATAPV